MSYDPGAQRGCIVCRRDAREGAEQPARSGRALGLMVRIVAGAMLAVGLYYLVLYVQPWLRSKQKGLGHALATRNKPWSLPPGAPLGAPCDFTSRCADEGVCMLNQAGSGTCVAVCTTMKDPHCRPPHHCRTVALTRGDGLFCL